MLSYRHIFHAGNHADVIKHAVLCLLLEALKQKEKPFYYLDTHAGAGQYELNAEHAQKNQEFNHGIARIWQRDDLPAEINPYVKIVQGCNASGTALTGYPGSPWIARELIRKQDHMLLMEWHPKDYALLNRLFAQDKRIEVRHANGYDTLNSVLPPVQRRGLVMIDPAYERSQETRDCLRAVEHAWKRWDSGMYAIWYPLHHTFDSIGFTRKLQASGKPKQLLVEFCVQPDKLIKGLRGCGMVIVNPPWTLEHSLSHVLPYLAQHLSVDNTPCEYRMEWLVAEK